VIAGSEACISIVTGRAGDGIRMRDELKQRR
jgi:hypothetical protein